MLSCGYCWVPRGREAPPVRSAFPKWATGCGPHSNLADTWKCPQVTRPSLMGLWCDLTSCGGGRVRIPPGETLDNPGSVMKVGFPVHRHSRAIREAGAPSLLPVWLFSAGRTGDFPAVELGRPHSSLGAAVASCWQGEGDAVPLARLLSVWSRWPHRRPHSAVWGAVLRSVAWSFPSERFL